MKYFLLFLLSTFSFAQQTQFVDFITLKANVFPNSSSKSISGEILYDFNVLSTIDTIKIDAIKMKFTTVKINNKTVKFKNNDKQLLLFEGFKKGKNTLTFNYNANPKQTLYFINEAENLQIWTQGQGKYTSHWLPSFDDVNEKVIFNLTISFDSTFEIISNGKLTSLNILNNTKKWQFEMQKPMSSYLVMMAIGKFEVQKNISNSGIPINLYLKPEDGNKYESTYKYSVAIFDFFEKEIGVNYPWEIYQQVPVNDFLYAGMENTTATIFSQDFVVDTIGFNDKNYINVNAHELAHQWFGNLITAKSGKDHWLQEGFATYYALLAEKQLFGDEHYNFELLKIVYELAEAAKTDNLQVLNEKASSLSFYKKGAWALHIIRENIGAENFNKAVKNYLQKYQFKNVTTDDFLSEITKVSPFDVGNFKKIWLEQSGFETQEAVAVLEKNSAIRQLFELQRMFKTPFQEKKVIFENILKSDANAIIKIEVMSQMQSVNFNDKKDLLLLAMQTDDIKISQSIAQSFQKIPADFKPEYERLLEDKSYITREIALLNLCEIFPLEISKYLEISKNWIGFNNKNLRITWLFLTLKNPTYQPENQKYFMTELINYSESNFDSSIRQNALESLLIINSENEKVLHQLVNATTHHKWQFVKFGKDTIRLLLKSEKFKILFQSLLPSLNEKEKTNLQKLLNE